MMRSYLIVDNNGYGIAHLMMRPYLIVRQHWLWHCSFDDAVLPHSATTLVMTLLIWWCGLTSECDNIGYGIAHLMMRSYLRVRQHWLWHCSFDECGLTSECDNIGYDIAHLMMRPYLIVRQLLLWHCSFDDAVLSSECYNIGYGIAHLMMRSYLIVRQQWLWQCSFDDAALPQSATTLVMALLIWWWGLTSECDNIGYGIAHLMMRSFLIVRQHWLWYCSFDDAVLPHSGQHWLWHCSFDDAALPQSGTTMVMTLLIWWCGLTS